MKITPITNNNMSSKGRVDTKISALLNSYPEQFTKQEALVYKSIKQYPNLTTIYTQAGKIASICANNILKNWEAIMSRFGKSCVLTFETSKKNPEKHYFMIKSDDSDYVENLEILNLPQKIYNDDLRVFDNFTNNLAKINPYEINLKFRTMRKPNLYDFTADSFAAEKEIPFIEDELVKIDKGTTELRNNLKQIKNDKLMRECDNFEHNHEGEKLLLFII